MTSLNPISAHLHGFRPETSMNPRPATEFEAAKAIAAFYKLIHAAENGNQEAENRIVKAAKAIGVKVDG